jgi:FixJ family two-component response regulator
MTKRNGIVLVVDDSESFRAGLSELLLSAGAAVATFSSAAEFLEAPIPSGPCCLLLDICMPGMGGLDLQSELASRGLDIPIIFLTGHADVPTTVRAMKNGAVEFLTKPFQPEDLLHAVGHAIERCRLAMLEKSESVELRARYATLTAQERAVMSLVTRGLLNKQIAVQLRRSEITVKVHRSRVMAKMQAGSLADLVRMGERLKGAETATGYTKEYTKG